MEWLTGGSFKAPKYVVIVKNEPIDAINEAKSLVVAYGEPLPQLESI